MGRACRCRSRGFRLKLKGDAGTTSELPAPPPPSSTITDDDDGAPAEPDAAPGFQKDMSVFQAVDWKSLTRPNTCSPYYVTVLQVEEPNTCINFGVISKAICGGVSSLRP